MWTYRITSSDVRGVLLSSHSLVKRIHYFRVILIQHPSLFRPDQDQLALIKGISAKQIVQSLSLSYLDMQLPAMWTIACSLLHDPAAG